MNSKEYLKRLCQKAYHDEYLYRCSTEKANNFLTEVRKDYNTIKQDLEQKEKLEKAIEILKEKIIDMRKILNSKNVEEYNNYVLCGFDFFDILTREEYELFKEVFSNGK